VARLHTSTARNGRQGDRALRRLISLPFYAASALALAATPASAADRVRITSLQDVAYGTITNFAADAVNSQDVCVFSNTSPERYQVTATGSGAGGSFLLNAGASTLPYEVQWSANDGRTTGTQLIANQPLVNLSSDATQRACNSGPPATASLIVILRSAAITAASSGTYTGTLTLLVAPE
jgi:hypothetical protein